MNIIKRTSNNIKYFYYMTQREKSRREVEKHIEDQDSSEFKYWTNRWCCYMKKCLDTPIK